MRSFPTLALPLLLALAAAPGEAAKSTKKPGPPASEFTALKREVQALKENQKAMQKELQEIKALLLARPAPAAAAPPQLPARPATVRLDNERVKGSPNARVVVIEYSDYQ